MTNFDVFISYPHPDKSTADAVCAMLEAANIRCWIAPRDVRPSADWAASIVDAIDNCRVMVLIFSSRANQSRQVHREVQRAFDQEKPVVPFRIENVAPVKTLAYYMGSVHWLDALTPPLERHIETLAQSVKGLLQVGPANFDQRDEVAESPPAEEDRRTAEEAEQQRKAAQAEAARRAEAERQSWEVDEARRAEEEAQRKKAETETLARAEEERRRQNAETARRTDQERAFAKLKRVDSVSAVDEFLSAYPASRLTNEAKALRAALVERDEAYKGAVSSDDPAVLKAFLDRYPKGKPADEVHKRLQRPRPWRPSRRTMLIGGGSLGAGALAATWFVTYSISLTPTLRFDGYYKSDDLLRFYSDGTVIGANLTASVLPLEQWFTKYSSLVGKGTYVVLSSSIKFAYTGPSSAKPTANVEGTIRRNGLSLTWNSLIVPNETGHRNYAFYRW